MKFPVRPTLGICLAVLMCLALAPSQATAQVAGANVNMVSGTQWPGGDPFLQRQNEPSVAVSSRNPFHLLAGANDYRSVDLALTTNGETGDAWLGLFKSLDGGASWRSILLPGCPYNTPICSGASEVRNGGFQAAADPTVRAGTNGMFYYAGLVFNRGLNPASAITVSRLIDLNNKENADPNDILNGDSIQYISTSIIGQGTSTQFLDKPTLAVDIPREDASTCNLTINQPGNGPVTQSFFAGNIYVAYTAFAVPPNTDPETVTAPLLSKIYFVRSTNCGATWSKPLVISGSGAISQGPIIAINPKWGTVFVGWRQFAYQSGNINEPDAIVGTSSLNGGLTFSEPVQVSTFTPFDEGTSTTSFRTNAYPTIAMDNSGRIYEAYSARNVDASGDARIVITTTLDGLHWTGPVPLDDPPIDPLTNPFGRGHQVMPALTFAGGTLSLLYYDLRLDHTFGLFTPLLNGGKPTGFYSQFPQLAGELGLTPPNISAVFNPFIDDSTITMRRHTFDLRVTQALPGAQPVFAPSVLVSQYAYGCCAGNQTDIEQLQFNAPNLPLFRSGTAPFMGDYVDIAASPSFLPPTEVGNGDDDANLWQFNTRPSTPTIFHAAWTDNRDVQAPPDGDWTHYTPPISPSLGSMSIFQPGTAVPACQVGFTGSRNQNIYTAPITNGLIFGAPSNSKQLGTTVFNGQTVAFQRAFAVVAQNTTNLIKSFRLTVVNQPVRGNASFLQFAQLTTLDLSIPPLSSAARPVFVTSTNPTASVTITIAEITAPQGTPVPKGLTGSTTLNPDSTNPQITNPAVTNPAVTNPAITNFEVTNPAVTNPAVTNPAVTNPAVTNPAVTNPAVTNAAFQNVNVVNPAVTNPAVTNPAVTNASIANPAVTNPAVTNLDPANTSISDTQWTVSNTGNTSGSFAINLAASSPVPSGNVLQLIISKLYHTPAATSQDCNLKVETHNTVVTNIVNPVLLAPTSPAVTDNGITNPAVTNATVELAPGESASIIIRTINTNIHQFPTFDPAASVVPVAVSQSVNTQTALARSGGGGAPPPPSITVPPLVIRNTTLPDGVSGGVYTASIGTQGGNPTSHSFSILTGSLPPGLTLSGTTGAITGVPTATGSFTFTVQTQDVAIPPSLPQNTATQSLTIRAAAPLQLTPATLPGGTQGIPYSQTLSTTGGVAPATLSLTAGTLPAGLTFFGNTISGTPTGSGASSFTIQAADSSAPPQIVPQSYIITIAPQVLVPAHVTFLAQPQNSAGGQLLAGSPLSVQVSDASGAVIPGFNVTMSFNGTPPCPAAVLGGTFSELTNASGVATFPDLTIDRGQVGYSLRASAGNVASFSNAFTVDGFCNTAALPSTNLFGTATLLNNGQVLIAGGSTTGATSAPANVVVAQLYDPATGMFTPTGSLQVPRSFHTATLLQDGRVLLTGGLDNTGALIASAELYDPATGTFSLTSTPMSTARFDHSATLLADGTVLIAGGSASTFQNTAELFNPLSGTFTTLISRMSTGRSAHTATLLSDGTVLLAGGSNGTILNSAELYNPLTKSFISLLSTMNSVRFFGKANLLPSGKVLLVGGQDGSNKPIASAEVYDPVSQSFSVTGFMAAGRTEFASSLLPNGEVLVTGGLDPSNRVLTSAEVYDPVGGTFALTGSMSFNRQDHTAVLLNNGTVLVAGTGAAGPAEIYFSTAPLAPLSITTLLPTAFVNMPYAKQLQEKGGIGNLTWTLTSGTLPAGLTLRSSGLLSGTPMAIGASSITVQVTDSSTPPRSATTTFVLMVASPVLVAPSLPTANPGSAYSQPITVLTGTPPFAFSLVGGALPVGLILASNGTVSGTTNVAPGTFTFVVKVTDSSATPVSDNQVIAISVAPLLAITTPTLPNGAVAVPYSATVSATGGLAPVAFSVTSGTLPPGLTLSPQGVLSGTPSLTGTFTFVVDASDSSASPQVAQPQSCTVVIAPASLLIIAPANFALAPGSSVQFVATLVSMGGTKQNVTSSVIWSSSNTTVATVSNTQGSQGMATTLTVGSTTISGSIGSVTGSTSLTVSASASVPRYLYLVNNEPSISSYGVNATTGELRSNGYLTATFPSGTATEPIAATVSGRFLYSVVGTPGKGGTIGSIFGYLVNADGTTTPLPTPPVNTASNASPSHIAVDPLSKFLYMSDCNNQAIWGFTIDSATGALTQIAGSPFLGAGNCFNNFNTNSIQLQVDPLGRFLYGLSVSNQIISAYAINAATGALTPVPGSPFTTMGTSAIGITEEPSGKFIYVSAISSGGNGIVDEFSIDQTSGALVRLAGAPFPLPGAFPFVFYGAVLTADPLGKFLYVLAADPAGGVSSIGVEAFTINPITGAIAPVAVPVTPSIQLPFIWEIVADPSGNFVFTKSSTVNPFLSVMDAFSVDRSSGTLTLVSENRTKFMGRINAIALSSGTTPITHVPQFAYVANSGDNTVSVYSIDPSSGILTGVGPTATGTNPQSIATDPSGKFLYVANQGSNNVSAYAIAGQTGLLSAIPGSPFAAGLQPVSITIEPSGQFAYLANAQDNSVSVYSVAPTTGVLTLSSTASLAGTGCTAPASVAVDPRGLILYVSCPASNNTFFSQINPMTGALGFACGLWASSPFGGNSISLHPSGKFAYLLNRTSSVINEFNVFDNQSGCVSGITGGITFNASTSVGPTESITSDPLGRYLYGAEGGFNDLLGYSVDFTIGTLTPIPGSPFSADTFPTAMAVDSSGRFAYVVNQSSNSVSAYSINPSTGALLPLATPTFPTGAAPVAVTTTGKIQ